MLDHLTIEDAEELGAAFCSPTNARKEIIAAVDRVFREDPMPAPRPELPAPGENLDSEPGLMTAGDLRDLVGRMANNRHVRYRLDHNHGPSGPRPPEGEADLVAFELLDVTGDALGGPLRAEPARVYERGFRERGFAGEVRGSSVYRVIRLGEEDGSPWAPRRATEKAGPRRARSASSSTACGPAPWPGCTQISTRSPFRSGSRISP